jgi:hypothetical protein
MSKGVLITLKAFANASQGLPFRLPWDYKRNLIKGRPRNRDRRRNPLRVAKSLLARMMTQGFRANPPLSAWSHNQRPLSLPGSVGKTVGET